MVPVEGIEPPCPKTTGSKPVAYAFRHTGVVLGAVLEPASSAFQTNAKPSQLTELKTYFGHGVNRRHKFRISLPGVLHPVAQRTQKFTLFKFLRHQRPTSVCRGAYRKILFTVFVVKIKNRRYVLTTRNEHNIRLKELRQHF